MSDLPPVVSAVVERGFCSGCGLCVGICPTQAIRMDWNELGMMVPIRGPGICTACNRCLAVCPFADGLVKGLVNPGEDELAEGCYGDVCKHHDSHLGFYQECLVGHASEYRMLASSGGMGTWLSASLLKNDIVDRVISVHRGNDCGAFFEYTISSTVDEVLACAQSRYYPVHVADVVRRVREEPARYAIVGLPCVLKAIRLAQRLDAKLRDRIVFCVGLFCSGAKTAFFLEYLIGRSGLQIDETINPDFRVKLVNRRASDTSVRLERRGCPADVRITRMSDMGDLWGTRLFVPEACDYCDDVAAELGDVSLGDAWLPRYVSDWRGTNLVIVRSNLARLLLSEGRRNGELQLSSLPPSHVARSQASSYQHRREGLAYRLRTAKHENRPVPRKRFGSLVSVPHPLKAQLYRIRAQVRQQSHVAWLRQRDCLGTSVFDEHMAVLLRSLRMWTRIAKFPCGIVPAVLARLARFTSRNRS